MLKDSKCTEQFFVFFFFEEILKIKKNLLVSIKL